MRYEIQPFGSLGYRHQLVVVEGEPGKETRTPLLPAYESIEAAEAEKTARERRNTTIRTPTAHRGPR